MLKSDLLHKKQRKIPLTLHEKGVTGTPADHNAIMDSPDWWAAKGKYNYEEDRPYTHEEKSAAADRIVDALWSAEKTEELKAKLKGEEPVFITTPSTSGANSLVPALAEKLCEQFNISVKIGLIKGEDIARPMHIKEMKNIAHEDRPYAAREYMLLDPPALAKTISVRPVVVVEDVFSSGASAKGFCDALAESRIQVSTAVGLMGDSRLDCEPELVNKLHKTFSDAGISVKARDVASVLSRGQVNILLDNINQARGKDEYARISANLQGVLDSRVARYVGEGLWRDGDRGLSDAHDRSDARLCNGVQTQLHGQLCSEGEEKHQREDRGQSKSKLTRQSGRGKGGLGL